MPLDFSALEAIVRQDPSGRGVAGYRHDGQWLAAGMLERAARDLAERGDAVAIVTGFCVADLDPPMAETDGPPGALYLARALLALGKKVALVSDGSGLDLLRLGCRLWNLDAPLIDLAAATGDRRPALGEVLPWPIAERLTHLIAIERVGPSHTLESIHRQPGNAPAAIAQFVDEVPREHYDHSHNMRGMILDRFSAPAHHLFAAARASGHVTTIGIGDGGNEIGMGSIPWSALRAALNQPHAGRIICRVATDFLLLAGVSNWGAYGLACATAALSGREDAIAQWNEASQRQLIERLVQEGGAVDGLTRRHEATVDGLPLEVYLDVLRQIITSK